MHSIPLFIASLALSYHAHQAPPRSVPGAVFVAFAVSLCALGVSALIGGRK